MMFAVERSTQLLLMAPWAAEHRYTLSEIEFAFPQIPIVIRPIGLTKDVALR